MIGLDSNSQALTELTKRQLSTRLTTYCVDIRDREALRLVHDAVFEQFGRIDGLLNNAAT
ncbi:SDR family NAD(P)-dependent oxidoreductase, partial [Metapseudomonas otitidis]|uniref:SDR family NAD(P)-dependent oxidoreductase n=1 Tax=Metapseudomonas otitidis TaxID=319939 RepID=UPI0035713B14